MCSRPERRSGQSRSHPIFDRVSELVEELRNKAAEEVDAVRANELWQEIKKIYEQFINVINENIPS